MTKEKVLQQLSDLLDSKVTINGDVIINYTEEKRVVKKAKKESKESNNEPKKDPNKPGSLAQQMRKNISMTKWKREVHDRDQVCQCCGDPIDLQCHHIMPLSQYPSLGNDVGNGILLCGSCHADYHREYEGSESAATLAKFMKENGQFQ